MGSMPKCIAAKRPYRTSCVFKADEWGYDILLGWRFRLWDVKGVITIVPES